MRHFRLTILSLFAVVFAAEQARAIPAFARKYGTSCQTCHVAFPKLNAFGEAFRMLGYRLPDETEDQVKQPDTPLGAEAYKRMWPDAIWPGAVPSYIPFAMVVQFLFDNRSSVMEHDRMRMVHKVTGDFRFPSDASIVAAGAAGDHFAFFGEIGFEDEVEEGVRQSNVGVGHFDIRLIQPFGTPAFNVKIGAFQPELVSTFDHARRLTLANYDSMFAVATASAGGASAVGGGGHHGGAGGISLPGVVRGIELFGVAGGRFLWSFGVANGIGPGEDTFDGNKSKDAFARVAYKFGGLAPDGSNAATFQGSDKNWREKSIRVGLFGYVGDGSDIFRSISHQDGGDDEDHGPAFVEDNRYTRVGLDFSVICNDLNVFGAYVSGSDEVNAFHADDTGEPGEKDADASGTFDYRAWFIETDLVLHVPWLQGALRYENVDLPNGRENWERGTIALVALVRANVKTTLEYTRDLNESDNYAAQLALTIGF